MGRWKALGLASCLLSCALLIAAIARAQPPPQAPGHEPRKASSPTGRLEDFERQIGPFRIKDKSFTLVVRLKRIRGTAEETVSQFEFRDATGRTAYRRSFPVEVENDHFVETVEVTARRLQGTRAAGILVTTDSEPSTPLGGGSYQVFGTFDGRLVPFSKPIVLEGTLVEPEPPEKIVRTATEAGRRGDVLRFRVWTGNFFVIVPVMVDWTRAIVAPAWRCIKMTSRGPKPVCTFRVEANRIAQQEELTFVRLMPEDFEPDRLAVHAVIKRDSRVEFIQAAGVLNWHEERDFVSLAVDGDVWLKVRIDGREGWIHTQEDFNAIGLPQAG